MKLTKKILIYFLAIFIFFSFSVFVFAEENDDKLKELTSKIEEYENTIKDLKGQQQTLKSTISFLNNKISLTQAQVSKTEKEIEILEEEIGKLSVKIVILDRTLDDISKILSSRITATYKSSYMKPAYLLLSSSDFSSLLSKIKYLKVAQAHDHSLMMQMERQKKNYDDQKDLKKEKQVEMEKLKQTLKVQTAALAQQEQSKQELLKITKKDEDKFQGLLATARAEMEAIQSIIAGKGEEVEVGDINAGASIASIIIGGSTCSTGTHLHFEVVKDGGHHNPASYLRSQDVDWDLCGWYGCNSEFSFSGPWDWPINGRPIITQGYGMTAYANSGAYGGGPHTGVDMVSDDKAVKSVKEGKLYRGSIACGGGTLRYVRVEHKDAGYDTYYLHVNYY